MTASENQEPQDIRLVSIVAIDVAEAISKEDFDQTERFTFSFGTRF